MADQRKAAVHHYSVPTHVLEHQLQREFATSSCFDLYHHGDRQQHFRCYLDVNTQLNLIKGYAILGI